MFICFQGTSAVPRTINIQQAMSFLSIFCSHSAAAAHRFDVKLTDNELQTIILDTDRDKSGDVDWDEYVCVLQHSCWFWSKHCCMLQDSSRLLILFLPQETQGNGKSWTAHKILALTNYSVYVLKVKIYMLWMAVLFLQRKLRVLSWYDFLEGFRVI